MATKLPIVQLLRKYDGPYFYYLAMARCREGGISPDSAYAIYRECAYERTGERVGR